MKVLQDTGCTGMIVDRALIPDSMVIPGSSGSLQMIDHTLIDIPLDSTYHKGDCKVMCISSHVHVYPVIIGNVRGARQMLPDWKPEDQRGVQVIKLGPVQAAAMEMKTRVTICLVGYSKRSTTDT